MSKKGSVWKDYKRLMKEVFNLEATIFCIVAILAMLTISYITGCTPEMVLIAFGVGVILIQLFALVFTIVKYKLKK
ncbi:hypothetical protein [Brevibacillus laterosporus]|uniref:hypothetical protein n=1 Tax=Brevibacillus laterosporus TaxID=1465 RepID=UPI002E239392|nr:hypothetical protein [Brevibacillus laterosporus]MED1667252.1 hypothetical protein [Brevibacillus laterosporus]MED1719680.1 hypothetical protein [Brevibacillus laterosporus]